jgi:hypothetical protein
VDCVVPEECISTSHATSTESKPSSFTGKEEREIEGEFFLSEAAVEIAHMQHWLSEYGFSVKLLLAAALIVVLNCAAAHSGGRHAGSTAGTMGLVVYVSLLLSFVATLSLPHGETQIRLLRICTVSGGVIVAVTPVCALWAVYRTCAGTAHSVIGLDSTGGMMMTCIGNSLSTVLKDDHFRFAVSPALWSFLLPIHSVGRGAAVLLATLLVAVQLSESADNSWMWGYLGSVIIQLSAGYALQMMERQVFAAKLIPAARQIINIETGGIDN